MCLTSSRPRERLLGGSNNLKAAQQALVHAHHCACIVKFTAVVWRAEECDQLPFREKFVAVFNDLVCTADKVHVVLLQEARDHIGSKGKGHASIVLTPAGDILIGIGPQKVTKQTAVWDLCMKSVKQFKGNRWLDKVENLHRLVASLVESAPSSSDPDSDHHAL